MPDSSPAHRWRTTPQKVITIAAGAAASSIALIGFGMDSVVEMGSGLVILWQFAHRVPEHRERQALRLIGACFLLLAGYVGIESARGLLAGPTAAASTVGIALAIASLLVMPALAYAKQRTGRALGSPTVGADAMQIWLCTAHRPSCSSDWASTPHWVGGGPIRWPA